MFVCVLASLVRDRRGCVRMTMPQYHVKIRVEEFANLSAAVALFADKADAIGGSSGTTNSLRNEILDQVGGRNRPA